MASGAKTNEHNNVFQSELNTMLNDKELLFILMPLKHDKQYKYVLDVIIRYINKPLHSYTYLSKFFNFQKLAFPMLISENQTN